MLAANSACDSAPPGRTTTIAIAARRAIGRPTPPAKALSITSRHWQHLRKKTVRAVFQSVYGAVLIVVLPHACTIAVYRCCTPLQRAPDLSQPRTSSSITLALAVGCTSAKSVASQTRM